MVRFEVITNGDECARERMWDRCCEQLMELVPVHRALNGRIHLFLQIASPVSNAMPVCYVIALYAGFKCFLAECHQFNDVILKRTAVTRYELDPVIRGAREAAM